MWASISEIEPATDGVADGRPALSTRSVSPETARASGCRKPNLEPEMVRISGTVTGPHLAQRARLVGHEEIRTGAGDRRRMTEAVTSAQEGPHPGAGQRVDLGE